MINYCFIKKSSIILFFRERKFSNEESYNHINICLEKEYFHSLILWILCPDNLNMLINLLTSNDYCSIIHTALFPKYDTLYRN